VKLLGFGVLATLLLLLAPILPSSGATVAALALPLTQEAPGRPDLDPEEREEDPREDDPDALEGGAEVDLQGERDEAELEGAPQEVLQVPPRNLPSFPGSGTGGAGVWSWDREALLAAEALTLPDLLLGIPGVVLLRSGDFGTPVAVTHAGLGPGQIRFFLDGIEIPPQEGGVVDLSHIGLAGLDGVRVERGPADLAVHLQSLQYTDPRTMTLLDVGTGDLRTNLFRASFAHPSVFGGTLLVALDRLDTQGEGRDNRGSTYGTRLRYTLHQGERGGISLDYRTRAAKRPDALFYPESVNRTDWRVQGRWHLSENWIGETFVASGTAGIGDSELDSLRAIPLPEDSRREVGVRLGTARGPFWVQGAGGRRWGKGWPQSVVEMRAGAESPGWGGASVSWDREGWEGGEEGQAYAARAWSPSLWGFSLFGEGQSVQRGIAHWILPAEGDDEEPEELPSPLRFTDRSGVRGGVRWEGRGFDLTAALLRVNSDSLAPMGLAFDQEAPFQPGGERTGVEFQARVPLDAVLDGLHLRGHTQLWQEGASWRYLPDRSWFGALSWHRTGYGSNLEIWTDVGARGRDPMSSSRSIQGGSPFFEAPFSQSWYTRLQIRVISFRAYVLWENLTLKDNNLEFPGRPQPRTRAVYGFRWTLWN